MDRKPLVTNVRTNPPADTGASCASMKPMPVIDSVTFVPVAWDVPGPVDVVAIMSDASTVTLFSYFPDELSFGACDLVGRSVEEARALRHRRDVEWLQT